ncbi:DnaA regulatory inactivator Hda [uncultured Azonexus sp.]|uniref:DnaA regulatory inactivator Hda n=1 Tax=uncultured Azonexus sp. TaxID=520307 RepID=UPI002639A1A9|nr:DnaA regulatory inactivator Hda [uncultured Azonexus sp.]MCA1938541.1 DnaA regulatory inactivator Hda [Dechloromonas sp.]
MRQLTLDLLPESPPSLDNFVAGGNDETVAALTGWLAGALEATAFCLHGETGCGKTHLLLACGFNYIDAAANPGLDGVTADGPLAVDNVEALDAAGQIALFALFNQLRASGERLLTAAGQPPSHLALREDLRTRLGAGLIYRLQPLSDAEKAAALAAQARERALKLTPEAIDYLMRHAPRNMRALSALIVALDRYTLEHKRAVTLPLLRELLNQEATV